VDVVEVPTHFAPVFTDYPLFHPPHHVLVLSGIPEALSTHPSLSGTFPLISEAFPPLSEGLSEFRSPSVQIWLFLDFSK
jgi:hypothetical protein